MNPRLKSEFLLDPEVIFLNHGSFGACPSPVMEVYQGWQIRLERQPVKFLSRDLLPLLAEARSVLAEEFGWKAEHLVLIPNATFGVNAAARSLNLGPEDQVLTTDHEYGACLNAWKYICGKSGADLVQQPLPLPVHSEGEILDLFWAGVTPRTRAIFISHITSPTALTLPVKEICSRAREAGILTVVDGAHAPGQIPLNLADINADFYTGNCHKWLMAPKGSAFLAVHPDRVQDIEPLVVSWGWGENRPYDTGSRLINLLEWRGTHDPAAVLSVPAALSFQKQHRWDEIRTNCQTALLDALDEIYTLPGIRPLYGRGKGLLSQMAAVELPPLADASGFQTYLYREHQIEIPVIEWQEKALLRISVQGYNQRSDLEALVGALEGSLPSFTRG